MSTQNELLKEVLTQSLLLKIGNNSVAIIKRRVADGIFGEGSSPGASNYSTKPFAMPVGAVKKNDVKMKIIQGKYSDDEIDLFRSSKSKKLWVIIKRGYKWLREQSGKNSGHVDMRWSGQMMRSLRVLKTNPGTMTIEIGHSGDRNEKIASWWNKEGAGRSHKLRKWLYLTDEELQRAVQ